MPAERPLEQRVTGIDGSDTSSAPSRGRLTTAIALMICLLFVTVATGPSYHGPPGDLT